MGNKNYSGFNEYLKNISKIPKISNKQRLILLKDNIKNLNTITESFLKLVVKLALAYNKLFNEFEIMDLIQEGNLGAIRGVEKYDAKSPIKLSTYVYYHIKAGIYDYIRQNIASLRITKLQRHKQIFNGLLKDKNTIEQCSNINTTHRLVLAFDNTVDIAPLQNQLVDNRYNPEVQLNNKTHALMLSKLIHQFRETLRPIQQYIFDNRIITDTPNTLQYIADVTTTTKQNIHIMEQVIRKKAINFFDTNEMREIFNNDSY